MRTKKSLIFSIISIVTSLGQAILNGLIWFVLALTIGIGKGFAENEESFLPLEILEAVLFISVGFFIIKLIISIISTIFSSTARFSPKKSKNVLIVFAVFLFLELLFNAALIFMTFFDTITIVYMALLVISIVSLVFVIIDIVRLIKYPITPYQPPVAEIVIEE